MSDAGKSQEPSMEEILASIRRIIAEDEAGRARAAAAPMPPRSDSPSRSLRRNGMEPPHAPQGSEAGDVVLDLTNMVAADGSVVTIAPTFPQNGRAAPPSQPQGFTSPPAEHGPGYSGFPRRAPPPGPEPRTPSFGPPPIPLAQPAASMGFAGMDSPRDVRPAESLAGPIPASLSEDSPSRRVFKRRHTAGSAFAELAQTGFVPPSPEPHAHFGQVPAGSVTTELDMGAPAPMAHAHFGQPASFAAPDPHAAPAFAPQPPAPTPQAQTMREPPPMAPRFSEEDLRAAVGAAAEPLIRSWLEANLGRMIEQQLAALVQQRVDQSITETVPQAVDQRIHQNVESNLGPYIEDRVGAHVDARLAAAVEEKVTAAVKQQVAAAVNQQISQAVSQQVAAAVTQQLQGQQQSVSRLVDERVKSEIRSLFSRLAGT